MAQISPVVTIDGSSGVGKGTISQMLAKALGWHFLDSGAIYRAVAWGVVQRGIDPDDETALAQALADISIQMQAGGVGEAAKIIVDDQNVSQDIRTETCGQMASKISVKPFVRELLLQRQRDMQQSPGLVADGRDMGTVVFPTAVVKFFFTASPAERAKRRYKQLKGQGISVSLPDIEAELAERDRRDQERAVSPTKPAPDAILIDTTTMSITQVFEQVLQQVRDALDVY